MNEVSEKLFKQLQNGTKTIRQLDPTKATHREAVFAYVQSKSSIMKTLKNDVELEFLKICLEKNYELFLSLDPEQYTEEFASFYLYNKIRKSKNFTDNFIRISYDENLIVNVLYQTCDGEQIFYYDKELQAPTFLIVKLQVSFKVKSIIQFFEKLDLSVAMLGYNSINAELTRWVNAAYRNAINKFIENKKIDAYKLTGLYDEIEKEIENELTRIIENSGLLIQKVNVIKLSIPETTSKLLEKQSLALVNEKNRRTNELEYEKLSLENYAKKAEIHSNNPNFEMTLTEAEKDFALNRYIIRHDVDRNTYVKDQYESSNELTDRNVASSDQVAKKAIDKPALLPTKKKNFSLLFFVVAIILTITAFVAMGNDYIGKGLLRLGFAVLFIGAGIIGNRIYKDKKGMIDSEAEAEYAAQQAEYNSRGGK